MNRVRRTIMLVVALVVAAAIFWVTQRDDAAEPTPDAKPAEPAPRRVKPRVAEELPLPASATDDPAAPSRPTATGEVFVKGGWGGDAKSFGRKLANESNPEAPMSITVGKNGDVAILDQVNRRVQRFDENGRLVATIPLDRDTAQDVLLADDGRTLVLDRFAKPPKVDVFDRGGARTGRINPLGGSVEEGGALTGLFADRGGVYVETEHDELVQISNADGTPATKRTKLPGRPSADGALYIKAGIVERATGRLYVQAHRRDRTLVWETPLKLGAPLLHILLLDTDASGYVYLGAEVGHEPKGGGAITGLATLVVRLTKEGALAGVLRLPPTTADPAETFRPLAVTPDGRILHMVPGSKGVTVRAYRFPSPA